MTRDAFLAKAGMIGVLFLSCKKACYICGIALTDESLTKCYKCKRPLMPLDIDSFLATIPSDTELPSVIQLRPQRTD